MTNPTKKPGVICRDVTKDYGEGESRIHALRGVNVEIHPGELTLLVGPSGCGKSTLISILAATLNATSGDVQVLGSNLNTLTKNARSDFRSRNVGFVFQQFNLLPALTASENVAVPLVIQGYSKAAATKKACEVLASVGMGDRVDSMATKLSGGQQQRVAIARALIHQPRLLVCDEPTSAVDAKTGQTVMTLIRELALSPDRITVVVTHDPRVFRFGDRIITMEDGRVSNVKRTSDAKLESIVASPESQSDALTKSF